MALALSALFTVAALWPQDAQPAFDADSFFSSPGAGSAATEDAADEAVASVPTARAAGLAFSGEASANILYRMLDPFDSNARDYAYTGVTSLRLDATGGDRDESKVEASAVVSMVDGDVTAMAFELKKLYLSVYTRHADLSAGRMIINYGRGTVFSPVDLFSAVDTADLALGRTGTDAVRVLLPFGDFSGLDLVATMGGVGWDGAAGGRFYGNADGLDFGISGFGDGLYDGDGDLVAAIDLKGDLELGISAEAVARLPFAAWSPDASEIVVSAMLGADYSLDSEWFFDVEYLLNMRMGSSYAVGTFRSGQNLFASVLWKPDELTALDLRFIGALAEAAVQATLSVSRNIASGASLAAYAVYRSGDVEGFYLGTASPSAGDATSVGLGLRLSVAY